MGAEVPPPAPGLTPNGGRSVSSGGNLARIISRRASNMTPTWSMILCIKASSASPAVDTPTGDGLFGSAGTAKAGVLRNVEKGGASPISIAS